MEKINEMCNEEKVPNLFGMTYLIREGHEVSKRITPLEYFNAEHIANRKFSVIDVFHPIVCNYRPTIPDKERVYLANQGIVIIGLSDRNKDKHIVIKSQTIGGVKDLSKILELPEPDDKEIY